MLSIYAKLATTKFQMHDSLQTISVIERSVQIVKMLEEGQISTAYQMLQEHVTPVIDNICLTAGNQDSYYQLLEDMEAYIVATAQLKKESMEKKA